MAMAPAVSIIVPTRDRPGYLEVALASIAPQAGRAGAELLVVEDGGDGSARAVAERHGAAYTAHAVTEGLNAARNTGVAATTGDLVVFVDDDVEAPEGWLDALLAGAAAAPDHDVFGGPIHARLEGFSLPRCGREGAPITELDLGPSDGELEFAWGANLAIRRAALERIGPFEASLDLYGDEEDWQRRHRAAGGRGRYVAAAGLDHRRAPRDARLRPLGRAAYARGRNSRRYDVHKGTAPALRSELRTLAGCLWHTLRRRCANGILMAAHSLGRLWETLDPIASGGPDWASGQSGTVTGDRARLMGLADAALDARAMLTGRRSRLARAARSRPDRRRVLVIGVDRPGTRSTMAATRAELERSRHDVTFAIAPEPGDRGKFENLNALLAQHPAEGHDWLLVVDDDVGLPAGFLDGFLFLAERYDLRLAQPAHRLRSHAAWRITRRRPRAVVRETEFVEIGPVTAFHRDTFSTLLPFPDLRMGWGLDLHWGAVAREHGWRMGVVDALPIAHVGAPAGEAYSHAVAAEESERFLRDRPYVPRREAERTLVEHRSW
jgi:GT2 family glycosyltransferase